MSKDNGIQDIINNGAGLLFITSGIRQVLLSLQFRGAAIFGHSLLRDSSACRCFL